MVSTIFLFAWQIGELYEVVKKWDGLADTLPQVVERLTALRDLHEQGKSQSHFLFFLPQKKVQEFGLFMNVFHPKKSVHESGVIVNVPLKNNVQEFLMRHKDLVALRFSYKTFGIVHLLIYMF